MNLDLFCSGHVAFPRRKLASIMDCDATAASRGKALLDLFQGSILFKKGLLAEVQPSNEVRLAVPVRDMLRQLVCGEKLSPAEDVDTAEEKDKDADGIGHVCDPEYGMPKRPLKAELKLILS